MSLAAKDRHADCGEVGELQLYGPVLFGGYFNNPAATRKAFTDDGWFITGDLAWLDDSGGLNLAGRTKDTININGAEWSATEIETAIEAEGIPGLVLSYTVAFPYREPGSPTEGVAIVYCPAYNANDAAARFETSAAISKVASLTTGQKPGHLIPLPAEMLEKSSLGKISRAKVRAAFEQGDYASIEKDDTDAIARYRESRRRCVSTPTESKVQDIMAELLPIPAPEISANASIFDLGITSFNLILLKAMIQDAIPAARGIPMSALMTE
jgi:acyl-CoA synthetase (AMP-forming)/AMP-acid ligase II